MSRSESFDAGSSDTSSLNYQFIPAHEEPNCNCHGPYHAVKAYDGDAFVGNLSWHPHTGEISDLYVRPDYRRQGIATKMWNHAYYSATQGLKIIAPQHSASRTTLGDRWARSVGGKLPRRKRAPIY